MMDKSKNLLLHLLQVLFFAMLSAMPSYIHAATGTVTITNPSPITVQANSTFNVQGTYLLSSDNTPTGAVDPASGLCIAWGNPVPGTYSPTYHPSFKWYWIYAYVRYEIDGVLVRDIARIQRDAWGNTSFGSLGSYNLSIDTTGMALGDHTLKVYLQDLYSIRCFRGSEGPVEGDIVAAQTLSFTILGATPPAINIALDKQSYVPCEGQQATINVTSNDPTPNGGTVTLILPDGSTASASFAGKTAALTLADFNLPDGYLGTFQAGDISRWDASVTTAAGKMASATASANIMAGGLNVTITPAKTVVEPKLQARSDVKVAQAQGAYTSPIEIYVTSSVGQPVTGANISLNVKTVDPTFAGHDHAGTLSLVKPTGTLTPSSGVTLSGLLNTVYTAGEFSAIENITATASYQGCTGTAVSSNITTQLTGLNNLVVNSPHFKIGGTDAHHGNNWNGFPTTPDNNHWVSASTAAKMNIIMTEYPKQFAGAGLYINDASLPKGGRFDAKGNWLDPHQTHRRGIDIDLHTLDTTSRSVKRQLEFIKLSDKDLFREILDEGNHLHIYFYPN